MSSRFLSVEDIAKDLGVTDETVRGYIKAKKLIAYRVGRDYKILKSDYDKFLEERRTDNIDTDEKDK